METPQKYTMANAPAQVIAAQRKADAKRKRLEALSREREEEDAQRQGDAEELEDILTRDKENNGKFQGYISGNPRWSEYIVSPMFAGVSCVIP